MSVSYTTSGLQSLESLLDLKMQSSKENLSKIVSIKTSPKKMSIRKRVIAGLQGQTAERWVHYANLEKKCRMMFENLNSSENSQKLFQDSIGQLSFQNEYFKQLNYLPYVLVLMSFFKVWFVPAMAVLTPFFMIVLPFFIVKYVYSMPINLDQYMHMMKSMWLSETPTIKQYTQILFFLISLVQGIVQPVQNAMHCHNTDKVICDIGDSILDLRTHLEDLREDFASYAIPFGIPTTLQNLREKRQAFMYVYHNKFVLDDIWKQLGELEILWKLAQCKEVFPVQFTKSSSPLLHIPQLCDISIKNPVLSNVSFHSKKTHALLTGPNGGGKSSALRAILQSVLLSQTFGYCFSKDVILTPFSWISTGLQLKDAPGSKSLFENEVRFAVNVLKRGSGFGIVLYDEIFHSTNPPDCARTAEVFLQQLWEKENILSIVSTHVFEIVERAPEEIQRLCVSGTIDSATEEIVFAYELQPGVSKLSSVDTILKREGLLRIKKSG